MTLDPKNPIYKCDRCEWFGNKEKMLVIGLVHYCPRCEKRLLGDQKKMLFVDDRTKRIHYALNNFPEYDVTIATCVPEALRQMVKENFDFISLDHDLNGHDFQEPDSIGCGMEIVRYLEKTGWPSGAAGIHKPIPEFWIHSSNLFAAHLMIVRLSAIGLSAYYKPIIYKVDNMKYDKAGLPI